MVAKANERSSWGEDIFSLGLQEILGAEAYKKLMILCGSERPAVAPVSRSMSELYGPSGARGLLICSGRAAFKYLLKQQGKVLGFDTPQFRLLPTRSKLKRGLHQIAAWMQQSTGDTVTLKSEEKHWLYEVTDGPARNPESKESNCDFTVGLIQEFLAWAGSGKFYRVKESACRHSGAACCTFIIDKFPLE
jgi:predicted hydrocarbon binding protein